MHNLRYFGGKTETQVQELWNENEEANETAMKGTGAEYEKHVLDTPSGTHKLPKTKKAEDSNTKEKKTLENNTEDPFNEFHINTPFCFDNYLVFGLVYGRSACQSDLVSSVHIHFLLFSYCSCCLNVSSVSLLLSISITIEIPLWRQTQQNILFLSMESSTVNAKTRLWILSG